MTRPITADPDGLPWRKASASNGNGQCVELAALPGGGIAVRDSKNPDGPRLEFPAAGVAAFLAGCRDGEFDDLAAVFSITTEGA